MANDAKQQQATEYIVLRQNGDGTWADMPPVEARSAHEAIRVGTKDGGEGNVEGVYKAIPMRSWKATVKITTRKVVRSQFEDVGETPPPATMKPQTNSQEKEPVGA